jgi:hypothetical protein
VTNVDEINCPLTEAHSEKVEHWTACVLSSGHVKEVLLEEF